MKAIHMFQWIVACGIALTGCGGNGASILGSEAGKATSTADVEHRPLSQRSVISATVSLDEAPVEGLEIILSRWSDYHPDDLDEKPAPEQTWTARTNPDGQVEFELTTNSFLPVLSGYYQLQAVDTNQGAIGRWNSIPISAGQAITLLLPIEASLVCITEPLSGN